MYHESAPGFTGDSAESEFDISKLGYGIYKSGRITIAIFQPSELDDNIAVPKHSPNKIRVLATHMATPDDPNASIYKAGLRSSIFVSNGVNPYVSGKVMAANAAVFHAGAPEEIASKLSEIVTDATDSLDVRARTDEADQIDSFLSQTMSASFKRTDEGLAFILERPIDPANPETTNRQIQSLALAVGIVINHIYDSHAYTGNRDTTLVVGNTAQTMLSDVEAYLQTSLVDEGRSIRIQGGLSSKDIRERTATWKEDDERYARLASSVLALPDDSLNTASLADLIDKIESNESME